MSTSLESFFSSDHEEVVICHDPAAGYRAIIAIHSTRLGPAVGGTRFLPYNSVDDALTDALRLARGMTYKNAVAGLAMGGGKAVIIGDPVLADRDALFTAHGRCVDRLGGRFITGEDVGTSPADLEISARVSTRIAGVWGRGGDPSPHTARGVFRGMQAAAQHRWGEPSLEGRVVAMQGCGNVGFGVAELLAGHGARLIVADVNPDRAARCRQELQASVVSVDDIHAQACDVFAPCALGGVLNDETIPRLQCAIVAGAANNQLQAAHHADQLAARGILYAPDYVINAGGVISGSVFILGESPARMLARVDEIHDTLLTIFERADRAGITTAAAADRLAEARLAAVSRSWVPDVP
jgi:leucine dehydrogenase